MQQLFEIAAVFDTNQPGTSDPSPPSPDDDIDPLPPPGLLSIAGNPD